MMIGLGKDGYDIYEFSKYKYVVVLLFRKIGHSIFFLLYAGHLHKETDSCVLHT